MNAIFLDLEGVVVTHRSIVAQHAPHLGERYHGSSRGWTRFVDQIAFRLVLSLVGITHSAIVVTSTLRDDPEIMSQLKEMAYRYGEFYDPKRTGEWIHGVTEDTGRREDEIKAYIKKYDVRRWVAVDDRPLNLTNFVAVDPVDGFSMKNYQDCKPFLTDDATILAPPAIFL